MNKLRRIVANEIQARRSQLIERLARRPCRLALPRGLVSFTFDDFPRSAASTGAETLRRHGFHGTFYGALGLRDEDSSVGPIATPDDLRQLAAAGHELGCHTFSHLKTTEVALSTLLADVERNGVALAGTTPGARFTSFSYPYGEVALRAKRALGRRFDSCRSVRRGINEGVVDLALLKANPIYTGRFTADEARDLIAENDRRKGWLIFYTHDVRDTPSAWGCTPAHLDAVCAAVAAGTEVLTVRDAIRRITAKG